MRNIQRLLNACFERSRACCCNFKGWCQYSFLWLVKGKENSALLSSCCLSAQKSWGSGATISTADSLCLKRSPVNQNSFSDKGKEAQKQNTKRQKQHTIKTQCSQQNPNLYSYCWGGGWRQFYRIIEITTLFLRDGQSQPSASFYFSKKSGKFLGDYLLL